MKAIAINGSPRKRWNTATLLGKALAGAEAKGAETELVHLYDLSYRGCISCFECKKIGGRSYGRCAVKDELTPVLARIAGAHVLILGSPVYFHTESGEMRSFMERLLFPYITYTPERAWVVSTILCKFSTLPPVSRKVSFFALFQGGLTSNAAPF